uniref:Uncharacterized protein n=1 Tax=viral metagenome TaxID=1070528 RepID=A0A6C0JE29_9ZZZZ
MAAEKNIVVGYSPNDFFYVDAIQQGVMPTDQECRKLKPLDQKWHNLCGSYFIENKDNCIKKELCINKSKAEYLTNIESKHTGSDEKFMNNKQSYDNVLLNTINLGIGILFLVIIIYKNRN